MNYLPQEDYAQAIDLELGSSRRVNHNCGDGNTMKINHTKEGISGYCFRCGVGGFTKHVRQKLSDFTLFQQREAAQELRRELTLPVDFTTDIPEEYALWLWRYGFHVDLQRRYGFGFSESLGRVVLPVYDKEELVYLQCRATRYPEQFPKYLDIAKGGDKDNVLAYYKPDNLTDERQGVIIITEDILSAAKVGTVHAAASILGTKFSHGQLQQLVEKYNIRRVIWWLDGDRAGVAGVKKNSRKLAIMGIKQSKIVSIKDPKEYSSRVINKAAYFQPMNEFRYIEEMT